MREVERRGCWPPVQPSHLRFHEPFFSFLSFFSSPLPKVRFLLCLLCNRGLAGCQEHVEWKCEVKLAFAEGERLSTLPRPACPYQLRGSLSPSLRHSLSFFLELVSGAPSAFNAATIGHRGGKASASKRSFAFPDAFCSRPSLSEPPLPLPVPLSRQTRHFHSFSSSNSKFRNWTAVSFIQIFHRDFRVWIDERRWIFPMQQPRFLEKVSSLFLASQQKSCSLLALPVSAFSRRNKR